MPDAMKAHFIRTVECTMAHFKLMYQDNSCMFFQTPKTKLFNDNYGDLHASILCREQHIAERLLNIIRLSVQQAPKISRLCARLDCMVAMARVALELQLVRPRVVADKVLSIQAGRHIMLQLQRVECTTNDTRLGVAAGKLVTILNAPNSSGKSVYMKQVRENLRRVSEQIHMQFIYIYPIGSPDRLLGAHWLLRAGRRGHRRPPRRHLLAHLQPRVHPSKWLVVPQRSAANGQGDDQLDQPLADSD